jgi:MFS family permease
MKRASAARRASDPGSEADSEPGAATPLLHDHTATQEHHGPELHHHYKNHPKFFLVVFVILLSLSFISIGDNMNRAPWMRIQEDIVCRSYYKSTFPNEFENPLEPIPEDRCKVPDVQARLAMLRGWDQTFSCIPSIITAVPYGVMADKYGRKVVLILSLFGICLSLGWAEFVGYFSRYIAIEWFWAGNAFLFIGGGSQVSRSTVFTILADVSSEDRRYVLLYSCSIAIITDTRL